jgi:hypothetical protein
MLLTTRWELHQVISTMMTFLKVSISLLFLFIIDIYLEPAYCVFNQKLSCEISEYVLMDKDKLAIDFARNSPEKTILVEIYPEFLYQKHIRCLLDPTTFLTYVVSISTMHISYFT